MIVLVLVQTVLIAVLTVLVAGLLRAHGTVLRRLHALDGGVGRDPDFAVRAPAAPTMQPTTQPGLDPLAHDVRGETVDGELVTATFHITFVTGVETASGRTCFSKAFTARVQP